MSDVLRAIYRGDGDEAERLAAGRELDVFEASALGRADRVRELVAADPSLVNAYGDDGFHPVGLASFLVTSRRRGCSTSTAPTQTRSRATSESRRPRSMP